MYVRNWNSWRISNCLPQYVTNWIYNCLTTIISTSVLAGLTILVLFLNQDFTEGLWTSTDRAIISNNLLTDSIATDSPSPTLIKEKNYFSVKWFTWMKWSDASHFRERILCSDSRTSKKKCQGRKQPRNFYNFSEKNITNISSWLIFAFFFLPAWLLLEQGRR